MEDYKEKTKESYNKNAIKFSEKFKELMDLHRRSEFQKFLNLIPGNKILDVGCGGGDHAKYFSDNGAKVICIDISEKMIKICKKKGLNAFVMDIEDLKFSDNSFDGIWAVTSLLHIPKSKMPKVIVKLHDILKKGGILYVCVKEGINEGVIKDKENWTERYFAFYQKKEITNLFKKYFDLIDFKKTGFGESIFLQFFFKKRL